MYRNKKAWWIVLAAAAFVKIFSLFPGAVERYYSTGAYPYISAAQRLIFGWIPWSAGDIGYGLAAVVLGVKLFRSSRTIVRKKADRHFWRNAFSWSVFWALAVYAVFNILWGLNYNRLGPAHQFGLQPKPYSTEDLKNVLAGVLQRAAETAGGSVNNRNLYAKNSRLFYEAGISYARAGASFPELKYRFKSVKPSIYSYLGDYLGYTGYYNPFTGEAQVNTTVPAFVLPFTTCHEIGHQLGYARENEANFAGYLAARSSADPAFRYSVYFDLYAYGIRELFRRDSTGARQLNERAPAQLKRDYRELSQFYGRFENPVEPYIRKLYGRYLVANEQPSGMMSYNEVMAFLVAIYKKEGADAL